MKTFNEKFGEADRRGETDWLQVFLPLHEKARPIIQDLARVQGSESQEIATRALNEAIEKLPPILKEMKAAPSPKGKELQEIKKKFEKGFQEFIDSCKYGVTYFKKPTKWNQNVWLVTAESAAKKLEEATVRFAEFSNK